MKNGKVTDEIVYLERYDFGVAIQTDQGLVVPVVRDADAMGLAEVEKVASNRRILGADGAGVRVDTGDLEILDGAGDRAHVARHAFAREHATRILRHPY